MTRTAASMSAGRLSTNRWSTGLAAITLAALVAAPAVAGPMGPEVQRHELPFVMEFGNGATSLAFPAFSTQGGVNQLLSVVLGVQATATLDVGFENMSPFSIELTINFGPMMNATATAGGASTFFALNGDPLVTTTLVLAAADAPAPNQSGPDYVDFGTVEGDFERTHALGLPGSAFFASVGAGAPVAVDITPAHFLSFVTPPAPGTGLRRWVSNFTIAGTATLEYQYNVVPTPGAMGLAWLAFGLTLMRRR